MPDRYMSRRMVTGVLPSANFLSRPRTKDTGGLKPATTAVRDFPARADGALLFLPAAATNVTALAPDEQPGGGAQLLLCCSGNQAGIQMSVFDQSEHQEDASNRAPAVRARIPLVGLAVVLSLLGGAVLGIMAYRYAATGGKPRTAPPAPVAAPVVENQPALSRQPAVRMVDYHLIDGNMQVTISLDQPLPHDAHRLDHPDRVYIDLHGARLAPELAGKTVFVNQGGIAHIRLAQTQPDTVRVVLDLEKRFDYSAVPQTNPAALVVKLTPHAPARSKRRPPGSQPKKTSAQ